MANKKRAIALGFFDGVHIGHAALLNKAKERASEYGLIPSVLTFDTHPDKVVFGTNVQLINSANGRERIIKNCFGIDDVVFIHFNRRMMQMKWVDFIESLISELNVAWIVVGHDFSFGYKGEGNPERLSAYCTEHGLGCDIIPAVQKKGRIVSSTYIRDLLQDGEIQEANELLGHPHILFDTVHYGHHLGTSLGAPTINMFFPNDVLIPKFGVYATKVCINNGEKYAAVTNIGIRPTVGKDDTVSVESHLIDFNGNLYGSEVVLEFFDYIRPEKKFASTNELAEQIKADIRCAKKYFSINAE